ncbi:MAG: hypothetical protein ABID54_00250 [Pseudomonadota bacterium]
MARKKTRWTRSGNTIEAYYLVTKPSGVTIDGPNATATADTFTGNLVGTLTGTVVGGDVTGTLHGSVDFGQAAYKVYMGAEHLTSGSGIAGGTPLSAGTIQFTTGLTTIHAIQISLEHSAASQGNPTFPRLIHHAVGYKTAGGVTVFLNAISAAGVVSACTPLGFPGADSYSGCTIHWIAVGV